MLVPGLAQQVQAVQVDGRPGPRDHRRRRRPGRHRRLRQPPVRGPARPRSRSGTWPSPPPAPTSRSTDARTALAELQDGWLLPPLRSRVEEFADDIDEARRDTALADDLLDVTPGLFGGDGDRRYLVVFLTPAELRGAGGFIGSYAELTASDGDVTLTRSGRIADLIFGPHRGNRTLTGPPDYLDRYGRFHPQRLPPGRHLLARTSPATPTVLDELYPQAGGSDIDGVIAVDPTGLAALLDAHRARSPSPACAEPLSADNAVEVLTRSQYLDLPDEAERGEILTEATRAHLREADSARRCRRPASSPPP